MGYDYEWDYLPAAHFTSLLWDALALIGLGALGFRFGGLRLGVTLAFAWAAYPFTQYVSSSNSNDAIMPALLIWGLVFVTSAPARGLFLGLAAWTKFASLLLLPLWASYPKACEVAAAAAPLRGRLPRGHGARRSGCSCSSPTRSTPRASSGTGRSAGSSRGSRRSRSGTGTSTRATPTSTSSRPSLKGLLVAAAVVLAFVPRTRNVVQLAALTGGAPDRLRARPDALVLPLHPLVLPLRRVRGARAGGGPGGGAGAAPRGFGR